MLCPNCREGKCTECVDRLRMIYRDDPICTCKRGGHQDAMQGEPRRQQIQDPLTGDVYGPGISIHKI